MTASGRTKTISLNMKMSAIKNSKIFSGLYFWLLSLVRSPFKYEILLLLIGESASVQLA